MSTRREDAERNIARMHELGKENLISGLAEDAVRRGDVEHSVACKPDDPAFALLLDDFISTPVVFRQGCYICEDPEFAQLGMPLCRKCPECVRAERGLGHIAADDTSCDECGYEESPEDYE